MNIYDHENTRTHAARCSGAYYAALLDLHHGVTELAYGEGFEYPWLWRFQILLYKHYQNTCIYYYALRRAVSLGICRAYDDARVLLGDA